MRVNKWKITWNFFIHTEAYIPVCEIIIVLFYASMSVTNFKLFIHFCNIYAVCEAFFLSFSLFNLSLSHCLSLSNTRFQKIFGDETFVYIHIYLHFQLQFTIYVNFIWLSKNNKTICKLCATPCILKKINIPISNYRDYNTGFCVCVHCIICTFLHTHVHVYVCVWIVRRWVVDIQDL